MILTLPLNSVGYVSTFALEIPDVAITLLCEFITTETYLDVLPMSIISVEHLLNKIIFSKLESSIYNSLISSCKFIDFKLKTQYTLSELISEYFNIIIKDYTSSFFLQILNGYDKFTKVRNLLDKKNIECDDEFNLNNIFHNLYLNIPKKELDTIIMHYKSIFNLKNKFIEYSINKPEANKICSILENFVNKNKSFLVSIYSIHSYIKVKSMYKSQFPMQLFIKEDFKLIELFNDLVSIDGNINIFPKSIGELNL